MKRALKFVKNYLDGTEKKLLVKYNRWLQVVFASIPFGATEHEIHRWHLPQAGELSRTLRTHAMDVFHVGHAHGNAECQEKRRRMQVKLADLPTLNFGAGEEFSPTDAIKVLNDRALVLAGNVETDIVAAVKKLLLQYLTGMPRAQVEERIADLRKFNENRASLIVTTETTYAYNRARLVSYRENNVDYVQFSAIMDSRTSEVCRSRHGLVMAMDDPRLGQNTPPLHGRCRSVLMPLYSRYEPKEITPERLDWGDVAALPKGWRT
ncbi:minor capsid protein [Tumebacillus flagellatus]|uniref:Phage head morphogenesis domain-containing protein n=1 Tax=Tumebacillus flagellatus TaxID=1157490 RepID=A0A074LKC9_9BACL|nr:minor capsid protein [Tumebacillus flagellatus]KEO81045.1 hypothetical protein EL26_22970 [Tumebacillus flagellatus]